MSGNVIALLCSDIHLSHNAPVARSAEKDWYEAQARPLRQLRQLSGDHNCPIIVAGDIFHRWDSGPQLINWAIENLPHVYAIPGQHDLPLHNYGDVRKSAYWTLCEAGNITDLGWQGNSTSLGGGRMRLYAFPWGAKLFPLEESSDGRIHIAVVHSYVWTAGKSYPNAPAEQESKEYKKNLKGYQVSVFGDNHQRFLKVWGGGCLYNCGCLIRRSVDERPLIPAVGMLHDDGVVTAHPLDCTEDQWIESNIPIPAMESQEQESRVEAVMEQLKGIEVDCLDFIQELKRYIDNPDNKVDDETKKVLLEVLDGKG